jgi:hypothetical protein
MREEGKRFALRAAAGMIGYSVLLPLSLVVLRRGQLEQGAAIAVALLPALPLFLVLNATVGAVRAQDELHRRIQLEGALISALVTAFVTFTYGLLEINELVSAIPMIWVLPFMVMVWGIAVAIGGRRYE